MRFKFPPRDCIVLIKRPGCLKCSFGNPAVFPLVRDPWLSALPLKEVSFIEDIYMLRKDNNCGYQRNALFRVGY